MKLIELEDLTGQPIYIMDHLHLLKTAPITEEQREKFKRFDEYFLGFRRMSNTWNQNWRWNEQHSI